MVNNCIEPSSNCLHRRKKQFFHNSSYEAARLNSLEPFGTGNSYERGWFVDYGKEMSSSYR